MSATRAFFLGMLQMYMWDAIFDGRFVSAIISVVAMLIVFFWPHPSSAPTEDSDGA